MHNEVQYGWGIEASPPAQLLYLCLIQHRNKDGLAYPGNYRLLEMTRLSRATLYRAFSDLEKAGYISRHATKSLRGRVYLVRLPSEMPSHIETGESHIETQSSHSETESSHSETHKYKQNSKEKGKPEEGPTGPDDNAINCTGGQGMANLESTLQTMKHKQAVEKKRKASKSDLHRLIATITDSMESIGQPIVKLTGKDRGMIKHILTFLQDSEHDPDELMVFAIENWGKVRTAIVEMDPERKPGAVPTIAALLADLNAVVAAKSKTKEVVSVSTPPPASKPAPAPTLSITTDDDE